MRIPIIILLSQLVCFHVAAQRDQSFRVNPVNNDSAGFYRSVYQYPQFTKGYILFKNQNVASAMLNYNRLSGQMLFIDAKGDTLEPADAGNIQYVAISNDTFYYFNKGYIELITHYGGGINLYRKETLQYNGKEKKGAYGGYSTTTAANSIDKISNENNIEKIGVDENSLYASSTYYYISGPDNNFRITNKTNFRKLAKGNETGLNDYLMKNKINYNNETDLVNLLYHLQK